jgi:2-polyprenyl-6-methoxyphenol hydroxylase-like FAD-dependent oxidoreductase
MIDVVIVGGGFSGTLAAVLLARAGYRVALVDRHPVYPDDFRAEHLDQVQTEALNRMQLLDRIVSDAPCVRYVVAASHGRVVGLWPTINYGIRYDSMVNAARTLLPPCAELVIGRVADLETGPVHQRITLADGRVLTARLLVLATGLGYALCSKLGIGRRVLHERHSLTFGFDMQPIAGDRFPFPFLVYQGERVLNQIDYLAAFEIGATMRANLFTYRDYRDQRWPAKFGQFVKWKSCLRAARVPRIRSDDDKTHTPDACRGFQGQSGAGGHQGREDAGRIGAAV